MFNLEKSILQWRRNLRTADLDNVILDELESHLRDEFDRQVSGGLRGEEAFRAAVNQIGDPESLRNEFVIARRRGISAPVKAIAVTGILAAVALVCAPAMGTLSPIMLGSFGAVILAFLCFLWRKAFFMMDDLLEPNLSLLDGGSLRALASAYAEAPRFNHDFVGTEHLLLGLTEAAPDAVRGLGLDVSAIRREIEATVGSSRAHEIKSTPLTPRAKDALRLAIDEAKGMNGSLVTPEHILLGLLREPDGVAARVLRNLGVEIEVTRERVRSRISGG
jgi:hypothetical protein